MSRRYRAPAASGAVLAEPGFDAVPALVEANRKRLDRDDVRVGRHTLRAFRALTKAEVFGGGESARAVVVTGHQPELAHPGVWVKNFAVVGLAKKLGAAPLNLVVDNDTLKSSALHLPVFRDGDPASVRTERLPFDAFAGEVPYEDRRVLRGDVFGAFLPRARELTSNWGYPPLVEAAWPHIDPSRDLPLGEQFAHARRRFEREWGCHGNDLSVSKLSRMWPFHFFAAQILADLPRFRAVYNSAVRSFRAANGIRSANHPAPDLAEGEAPFWARTAGGRRQRATAASDAANLRPRALTLTLFARVCLGDFFIHGIGGGKYDEVTDAIIRDYFGIEPPAYQVLSATLHLPLPGFPSTAADVERAARAVRDLRWNPHALPGADPELVRAHAELARHEPPWGEHDARRERFRALQRVKDQLRAGAAGRIPEAAAELRRVREEAHANAVLQRRDYAWVLYPEGTLRPFLQRFLAL
ncbi:MAG: hypothetical protein ACKODX_11930 [Gemmata sp.]